MDLDGYKKKIQEAQGKRDALIEMKEEATSSKEKLIRKQQSIDEAQSFFQVIAKETQEQIRIHVEDLVESCLNTCFPGEYEFHLDFVLKRGKTEANLVLCNDYTELSTTGSTGGGVVDLLSFGLRMAALSVSNTDNVLILDEPFKNLSRGLRPLAAEMLQSMSEKLDLQMIIVTHDEYITDVADRVYTVSKNKKTGISTVKGKDK